VARPIRLAMALALCAALLPPAQAAEPVGAGAVAPDFTLPDQDGQARRLSAELARQRAVVLVFYRGHW